MAREQTSKKPNSAEKEVHMRNRVWTWIAVLGLSTTLLTSAAGAQAPSGSKKTRPAAAARESVVDLNKATVAELAGIPGIGEKMAQRIVNYRAKNGAFSKVEELMNVSGIGEKKLGRLRSFITVGSKSTGNSN